MFFVVCSLKAPAYLIADRAATRTELEHYRASLDNPGQDIVSTKPTPIVPTPRVVLIAESSRTISLFGDILKQHGLRVCDQSDISSLSPANKRWQPLIEQANIALLVFTRQTLNHRINDLQSIQQLVHHPGHQLQHVMLFFDAITEHEVQQVLKERGIAITLDEYAQYSIAMLEDTGDAYAFAQTILRDLLPSFLRQIRQAEYVGLDAFQFGLPAYTYPAQLLCDWRSLLETDEVKSMAWEHLQGALESIKHVLATEQRQHVAVRTNNLRLSAGLLIGFVFRAPAAFALKVRMSTSRDNPEVGEWWSLGPDPRTQDGFEINNADQDAPDSTVDDIALEVSITADVHRIARKMPVRVGRRIHMCIAGGPSQTSVRDNDHATALVHAISTEIKELRKQTTAPIHLFISAPVVLMVLLGTQLNRCGPVQMYEYVQADEPMYVPSCRLTR